MSDLYRSVQDALSSFAVAMVQRFDLDPDTFHDCDTTLGELVELVVGSQSRG